MARLLKKMNTSISEYRDRRFDGTQEEFDECLRTSTTVYVGNLSFYTTEEQLYETFSKCGDIKRIIMGLHKQNRTPCGFCFVVFYTREDTEDCVKYINGTTLDDRPIRVDFDWGFQEGRQYGRGVSGGQVRDEYRLEYDSGRGGYGEIIKEEVKQHWSGMNGDGGNDGRQYARGGPHMGHQRGRDLQDRHERAPPAKRQRVNNRNDPPRSHTPVERNPRFREEDSDHED